MIYGIFHKGSGLGNQLHRYVATRIKAQELGVDFSMINSEGFKGKSFMNLDLSMSNKLGFTNQEPQGKTIVIYTSTIKYWEEWDKRTYDPDYNFIEDKTIIDGNFEDERYFTDYLYDVDNWLEVERLEMPENLCVIGFRGGEFYSVPELGLPQEYYDRAIERMREVNPRMKFEVHTDDLERAKEFFPYFTAFRDIEMNWRSVRYAKYAIIANSSFYVLPRLLQGGLTIAPRYFNRYNTKQWEYPQSYYKKFTYI